MSASIKERPIIFSPPMVKAILEDRKTQTRRVIKPQPTDYGLIPFTETTAYRYKGEVIKDRDMLSFCPYGQVGDRLYCRETWRINAIGGISYKADEGDCWIGKWKPSIFMPRWASRITLEITSLRAERLQEISLEDIKAEGHEFFEYPDGIKEIGTAEFYRWFIDLWDSLNAKRGYGWETNPWVWVIGFRRLEATQ